MNLTLIRKEYRADGIFGELYNEHGEFLYVTLEHSYASDAGSAFRSKLAVGTYTCVRGTHTYGSSPFLPDRKIETFEVQHVPGHTGILFHPGNYNRDSEGCILVGTKVTKLGFEQQMITNSKIAFEALMHLEAGVDKFQLAVIG